MESWMISLAVGVVTYVATFITMKNKIEVHQKTIDTQANTIVTLFGRLDKHGDDIVKLNTKSELAMTSKDVDSKYVSKELFRQYEKHIDGRFDRLEEGQGKILAFIEEIQRSK